MVNKNFNIDSYIDCLGEIEEILPSKNFKNQIFEKIKKNKSSNINFKMGSFLIILLLINIFSVLIGVSQNYISNRDVNLRNIINTFSLDK